MEKRAENKMVNILNQEKRLSTLVCIISNIILLWSFVQPSSVKLRVFGVKLCYWSTV